MPRRKKNISDLPAESSSLLENSTFQTNLELDNRALKIKNANLVKANAKLQLEKAELQVQNTQLQEDFFKLNSTFVNLKNINSTIDLTIKTWFPKFVEFSDMFTKIMQLCSVGKTVSINKDTRTQAVQPHAVNGHVLQHPTISLSRLNNSSNVVSSRRLSNRNSANQNNSRDERVEPGQPSTEDQNEESTVNLNSAEGNEENENEVESIVVGRRFNIPIAPLNMEEFRVQEEELNGYEEINNQEEYCSRLLTIHEENESNFNSSDSPGRITSREVKIYIDRLPSDFVRRNVARIRNRITDTSNLTNSSSESTVLESENANHSSSNNTWSPSKEVTTRRNNSSSKTNATVIQETVYRRTVSPLKRREAQYFGEPSSFLQTSDEQMPSSLSSFSGFQTDQNLQIPDNISAIPNVPSCSTSHFVDNIEPNCSAIECSKEFLFNNLGIKSKSPSIATSTPLHSKVQSKTSTKQSLSIESTINDSTPSRNSGTIISKVTFKRGGNDKKKIPQVVLDRMSFEKRLSDRPARKSRKLSDTVVNNVSSHIGKRKKKTYKIDSSSSSSSSSSNSSGSDIKENVDTSNGNSNVRLEKEDIVETFAKNKSSPDKKIKGRLVGKGPKRFLCHSSPKKSPRPKRAARPTVLKEATLNKKMRRSK